MEGSLPDVLELLAKAANRKDYASAEEWIKKNKHYLTSQEGQTSEDNRNFVRSQIGKVIRDAAFKGQVARVEFFRSYGHLNERGEEINQWTAIHCAIMGVKRRGQLFQSAKLSPVQDDQLQIIYLLHEFGADITVEAAAGETPIRMALNPSVNFKIAAVLLEKLQKIQNEGVPPWANDLPAPTYEECIQMLVEWAAMRGYTKLVIDILSDPSVSQELIEKCLKIHSNELTLFHKMADIGNDKLFEQLIRISKIPPKFIANCRYTNQLPGDSEWGIDEQEISQTPVSLAIGKGHIAILKTLRKLNENLCTLNCLNLTSVNITNVPEEILTFSTLRELDLSKNELADLPLNNINKVKIEDLNLSKNKFSCVPDKLFDLPMIKVLNVSCNDLECMPTNWWRAPTLQELDLSNNKITKFGIEPIYNVNAHTEKAVPWSCSPVHQPVVSHVDCRLQQRTSSQSLVTENTNISDQSSLTVLRLNKNRLKRFPLGLACLAPKLESLYIANNKITDLCSIKELPSNLQYFDISSNFIGSSNIPVFKVAYTPSYCLRVKNQSCNHMNHEDLCNLEYLNCSHNKLMKIYLFSNNNQDLLFPKLISLDISNNKFSDLPLGLHRFTDLKYLYINDNPGVTHIPGDIGYLSRLSTFVYHGVTDPVTATLNNISDIADKLTYLRSMQQSSEKNSMVNLKIVGPLHQGKSTLLSHLKSTDNAISQPVTFYDRQAAYTDEGTAMQSYSSGRKQIAGLKSTVGIDIDCFFYDRVKFITWDFSGQEEYFSMHQYFIVPGSIYVICCRAKNLFDSGVSTLLPWLAMIKAKAPGSPVMIIGTFCDQLSNKTLKQSKLLRQSIVNQFSTEDASCSVEIKDVVFVKCLEKKQSCIADLQKKLYELATTVKVPSSRPKQNRQNLLDQLVPIAYINFRERLLAEASRIRRHLSKEQPVLTWNQLQELSRGVCDEKELHGAVEYMKRNGMLIYFNTDGLQDVYFIDPQWLIDKLALIVSAPKVSKLSDFSSQNIEHPEIIDTNNLMTCLSDNMLLPSFQNIFSQLLFHFEVAIPIDKSCLFFPSLMSTHYRFNYSKLSQSFPRNNDLQAMISELNVKYHSNPVAAVKNGLSAPRNIILERTGLCYRRYFILTVVPPSIWPRLICRCLTDSKFLEIIKKSCLDSISFEMLQDLGKIKVGNAVLEWIYWKNGIEWKLSGKTLLQISSVDFKGCNNDNESIPLHAKVKNMYLHNGDEWWKFTSAFTGGLEIITPEYILLSKGAPSQEGDLSQAVLKISKYVSSQIFTHSIEVIDEIFTEWFSSTNSTRAIGESLITFTPCPICVGDKDERNETDQTNALTLSRIHVSLSRQSAAYSVNRVTEDFQSTIKSRNVTTQSTAKKSKKSVFTFDQQETIFQANKFPINDHSVKTIGENFVGFTTAHCLWVAWDHDYIECPKHGKLELQYLTPDLVYVDVKDFIISKKRLKCNSKQHFKQGGFGKISQQQLLSEEDHSVVEATVAVKVLVDNCMHTPASILQQYGDNRRELNMIYGLEHPRIVKFYGITVHPVGFVMEWAGMGSLDDIITQHQSQRQYICPDSVYAVALQVVTGLNYLHKNNIVHFDIKPQNILICKFPHESHCCHSNYTRENLRCIHCSKTSELDGVVTKIADLGISVRKGPRGFVRKVATPCHTAPETLLHCGKEHSTEKVDIFSLGICLYETMSCTTVPPKKQTIFEFEEQLKNGNRPSFSENVPRYPSLLYECMTSCWDQDPQTRPSAAQLLDTLSLTKLQLFDSFVFTDHKLTDVECCCKVFSEENKKETLWLAVKKQPNGSSILVIEFQMNKNKVVPKVTQPLCFTEKVLKIYQVRQFVYIILEGVKIVMVHSQTYVKLNVDQNTFSDITTRNPCGVCYIQNMNRLLVAFTNGDIGIVSVPENQFNLMAVESSFQYGIISSTERRQAQMFHLGVKSHFICMEVVAIDESANDIWCGSHNNTIVILSLSAAQLAPVVSQTIKQVSGSVHVPCEVVQLKMIKTLHRELVCGLLNIGNIVCYDAGSKVLLKRVSAYRATVMLPCNNKLYLGTKSGQILSLNINSIITDETTYERPLECGKHSVDQPVFDLLTVTGELSPHSFLEGFGSVHCKPTNKPCKVMLSIGGGYTEFFSCSEPAITVAPNDLCIISFKM